MASERFVLEKTHLAILLAARDGACRFDLQDPADRYRAALAQDMCSKGLVDGQVADGYTLTSLGQAILDAVTDFVSSPHEEPKQPSPIVTKLN